MSSISPLVLFGRFFHKLSFTVGGVSHRVVAPFCLLSFLIVGCGHPWDPVTFAVGNNLDSDITVEYTFVCRGDESINEKPERFKVEGNATTVLFTAKRDRGSRDEHHFVAMDQTGQTVCEWTYEHGEVGRYMVLTVPLCSSLTAWQSPRAKGTQLPPKRGCGP